MFLALALNWGSNVVAQPFPYRIEYLTTDDGLPQNTVDYIYKDSQGFVWFATWNGLCRYDGYEFKTFKSGPKLAGLPSNFVYTIAEDANDLLWIGTLKGISIYDLAHDRFRELDGLPDYLREARINTLQFDRSTGRMWIGTENEGFAVVSTEASTPAESTLCVRTEGTGLLGRSVTTFTPTIGTNSWIGTRVGLWRNDAGTVTPVPLQSLSAPQILSLFFDRDQLWIGTDLGLIRYGPGDGQERLYQRDPFRSGSLLHNTITAIGRDVAQTLLIGTLGGLNLYREATDDFTGVTDESDSYSLLNNRFVNSILADRAGNVWIGTEKGGVNKYNLNQHQFGALSHSDSLKNGLSNARVNSIYSEGNTLWVGTAGGGLNEVDRVRNTVRYYQNRPGQPNSLSGDFVTSIQRDDAGALWVGTWGNGLNKLLNAERKTFASFTTAHGLASAFVSSVHLDPRGFFLVGTESGLNLFDPGSERSWFLGPEAIGHNISEVGCILLDGRDDYWVGTRKGVFRFPADRIDADALAVATDAVPLSAVAADLTEALLSGYYTLSLHEDRNGTIWIGTYGHGLIRATRRGDGTFDFTHYREEDGLSNNVIYGIEEDDRGRLWLSTDYGLSCLDPQQSKFTNYYTSDGLLSNQFYWSASTKDATGNLYFGSIEGLVYFDPRRITDYAYIPEATLTGFNVLNNPVRPGEERYGRVVLETAIENADTVQLSYQDNAFSIEFTTLDYFLSDKVRFAYRMEGVDQDWIEVSADRRFANYTNLGGGEYLFSVKASNGEGQWQAEPTTLRIIVHPPFWQTLWFKLLFAAALIGGVLGYIRWRTFYLRRQTKKLERLVGLRTQKIARQKTTLEEQARTLQQNNRILEQRQSKIEHQKEELETKNHEISEQRDRLIELNQEVQKVNRQRMQFFTNVSHEFRTPLTLIIDPIESLLKRFGEETEVRSTLDIINRNARRLLHLINQLMNFRSLEEGKVRPRVTRGDLVGFIRDVHRSFQDLANHHDIDYEMCAGPPPREAWFDAEKLEHIVYNLLSNAFKYTPPGGKISLELAFEPPAEPTASAYFTLSVRDTGIGIESSYLEHIFDHFYRAPNAGNATANSSGIGLALVREFVELMRGEVGVESEVSAGSTFTIRLPYSRNAFRSEEIVAIARPVSVNLRSQVAMLKEGIDLVQRRQRPATHSDGAKRDSPLVLIVEDNDDLRAFLAASLGEYFRILSAADGREGYALAKKHTPDLIVSDIMMPYLNGVELCTRLKSNLQTSHIPLILLTAKAQVDNWVEGLESGADDYVPKPFNLEILLAKIKSLIRSRKQLKLLFGKADIPAAERVTTNPVDQEFLTEAYAILEANYTKQEFSHDQFASALCVSRSLLYKKIKSLTDMSVTDFINFFKLKKAAEQLQRTDENIAAIAYQTGFSDPKYFSRVFKKFYGMPPSEFASSVADSTKEQ